MQDLAGYAVAATAYITTRFIDGPGWGDNIQSLYESVRQRLDDDDHLGAEYVASSPHSVKARRTLAEDIEYAAGEHPDFAADLISRVDALREAGGLDYLTARGGLVVVRQVVDHDRRAGDVFHAGLARALGPGVQAALLAAPAGAGAAGAAGGNSPTMWQIVYYFLGLLTVAGLATTFYASIAGGSKPIAVIGIAMMAVFGTLVGILHRMPRLRGVSPDSV
ncbi:hypothetical protein Aca07nite_41890 [Actinoplanes capillaceus]|uniref:Uncharacterized protein n=1 Tax=Actinoplanes campanulatus TaxID=113559 RepID=A0ABQ3WL02_9ACTN|nr:hypothetical protein [Actinoplanes capillaceus]GID46914.1 hypothetical protein Aca07nite_41890 [Actinoplanes capillaceus]